jgi:hypothetical protein
MIKDFTFSFAMILLLSTFDGENKIIELNPEKITEKIKSTGVGLKHRIF